MKYNKKYLNKITFYIMLVFVPLIALMLGTFIYIKDYQKKDLSDKSYVEIQQIGSTLDMIIKFMEYGMINNIVSSSFTFEEKYNFSDHFATKVLKNINNVMKTNDIFDSIIYLDKKHHKAIISGFGESDINRCSKVILNSINTDNEVVYTSLWEAENGKKIISLIVKDELDGYSDRMIVYNIDVNKLFSEYIIKTYKNGGITEYFLYNSRGGLIVGSNSYGTDNKYDIFDENVFSMDNNIITNKYKMYNDWFMVSRIKTNLLYNDINILFVRLLTVAIIIGILTLIILYFISKKIYKPINNWYQRFRFQNDYRENDIDTIEHSIDKMISDNSFLNERIRFYSSNIKEIYIYNKIFNHQKDNDAMIILSPIKVLLVFYEVESIAMSNLKYLLENIGKEDTDGINTKFQFEGRNSYEWIIYFDADDKQLLDKLISKIVTTHDSRNLAGKLFFEYDYFENIEDANVIYEKCLKKTLDKYYKYIFELSFNNGISNYHIMLNICRSKQEDLLKYLEESYLNNTMTEKDENIVIINFFFVIFKLYEECNIKINDGYYYMFMNCFNHTRTFTDISLIFKILLKKLNNIEYNTNISFHNEDINNRYIKEMYKFIEKNYHQNIGLSEIADHLNITKQYLCSIIKKQFDLTLHDILNKYRVEKAMELLSMDYKIIDISKMVGFSNSTYFSVVFKKIIGIKPSEYRRNNFNFLGSL